MKNDINFTRTWFSYILTVNIIILFLFVPFIILAQPESQSDQQIQRMKQHYQEWLSMRPEAELLVEYDPAPIAMDYPNPRFTWIMNLVGRGRKQTGYQILVATSKEKLSANEGDMWNPGLVESDQSSQVRYIYKVNSDCEIK